MCGNPGGGGRAHKGRDSFENAHGGSLGAGRTLCKGAAGTASTPEMSVGLDASPSKERRREMRVRRGHTCASARSRARVRARLIGETPGSAGDSVTRRVDAAASPLLDTSFPSGTRGGDGAQPGARSIFVAACLRLLSRVDLSTPFCPARVDPVWSARRKSSS